MRKSRNCGEAAETTAEEGRDCGRFAMSAEIQILRDTAGACIFEDVETQSKNPHPQKPRVGQPKTFQVRKCEESRKKAGA
jgi:hypothetical protein